jgi:hypothetical protein
VFSCTSIFHPFVHPSALHTPSGGKNPFLGIAYIVVGALSLVVGVVFTILIVCGRSHQRYGSFCCFCTAAVLFLLSVFFASFTHI